MKLWREKTNVEIREIKSESPIPSGLVAKPRSERTHNGIPHWLAKYGLGAWAIIGIALVIFGFSALLGTVHEVFLGVFLAFVLTSVFLPMVDWLDQYMPRALATALSILAGAGVVLGLAAYVVFSVAADWDELAEQFSEGFDDIIGFITDGPLPVDLERGDVINGLSNAVEAGTTYVQENAATIGTAIMANAGTLAMILTILALSLFVTVCFLYSGREMWLWFLNRVPARHRSRLHRGAHAGWTSFSGYAAGTVIISFINGILAFAFLWIVGVPLAAPLAVLVMIGTYIPLVGAPAAMIIAMLVALAANGVVSFIVVGLGIAAIGQLEGNLFQPLIMGKQVSLHPALVAVGVAAGGFAGGLVGAVIAIPLMAVIWSVYKELHVTTDELDELPPPSRSL